jgi:hypothetical protein
MYAYWEIRYQQAGCEGPTNAREYGIENISLNLMLSTLNTRIISMCISSPKIDIATYTLKKDPDSRVSKYLGDSFNWTEDEAVNYR